MDKKDLFKKYLNDKKESLLKSLERAKDARDNAPSAMESHSDTRRSQAEKLVVSFELDLNEVTKLQKDIDSIELKYIELTIDDLTKKFLIVPSGIGGAEMNGIRFLSVDTPLEIHLRNKNVGDIIEFNNQKLKIVKSE